MTTVQACLNGSRPAGSHPALPLAVAALAAGARACAAAGGVSVHLHARDAAGAETLDAAVVEATARAVRSASGLAVGVSTGEWIVPDVATRVGAIEGWSAPDFASVNLSEDGAVAVIVALLDRGIDVEAGLATVGDVARLLDISSRSQLAGALAQEATPEPPAPGPGGSRRRAPAPPVGGP